MNIATCPSKLHPGLLDATIRYKSGLFQFLSGLVPKQIEFLQTREPEEVREIASSKNGLWVQGIREMAS